MPMPLESFELPRNFQLEPEILEQLSSRPGHQRCVEGNGELLLVVHDVPKAGVPERSALFFWKRANGEWEQNGCRGLGQLSGLLDRYACAIDSHEEVIDEADTAAEVFAILRHAGPLMRSSRHLVHALEEVLEIDPDDREIRNLRDRGREIERAAELLHSDARLTLEFWQAENAEEQNRASARLNKIAYRLNLLAGFFLPLVALGGLFGMNVDLPHFTQSMFWGIVSGGLLIGGVLLWMVGKQTEK
ncbi:MAG: CorA family divalent cation transporter [Luteolibacter sp.]